MSEEKDIFNFIRYKFIILKSTKYRHLSTPEHSLFNTSRWTQIPILYIWCMLVIFLSLFSKEKCMSFPPCKQFLKSLLFIKLIIIIIIIEPSIYFKSNLWNKVRWTWLYPLITGFWGFPGRGKALPPLFSPMQTQKLLGKMDFLTWMEVVGLGWSKWSYWDPVGHRRK